MTFPLPSSLQEALATTTGTATRTSKKQQVYYAKQQRCITCTFLYRPCTTTTWKCLIASFMVISYPDLTLFSLGRGRSGYEISFMEDVNKRRQISFSLSKLECGSQEINSREIRLHLPFSLSWNKRDKLRLKKREFILKLTFSLQLPSLWFRKVPTFSAQRI